MTDRTETFLACCNEGLHGFDYEVMRDDVEASLIRVMWIGRIMHFILCAGPRITHPDRTNWALPRIIVKDHEGKDVASTSIAVCVFHGPADKLGTTEPTSAGNKWKPDYRRIARMDQLRPLRGSTVVYKELFCGLTAENLSRLFKNETMELVGRSG